MAEVSVATDPKTPETEAKPAEVREPYERPTIEMFRPMTNVAFGTNVTILQLTVSGP
jgi:hypothetical protein